MPMNTFWYMLCMVLMQMTSFDHSAYQPEGFSLSRMQNRVLVSSGLAEEPGISPARGRNGAGAGLGPGKPLTTSSGVGDKAKATPPPETLSDSKTTPVTESATDGSSPSSPSSRPPHEPSKDPAGKSETPPSESPSSKSPSKDEPLLSPGDPEENNHEKKEDASAKIMAAQELIQSVNADKLSKQQHETLAAIESFLQKSHEALSMKDYPRALNLAKKAHTLASELVNSMGKKEESR